MSIKGVLDSMNDIRQNPSDYIPKVQAILDKIDDEGVHTDWRLSFHEGKAAWEELKTFLGNQA